LGVARTLLSVLIVAAAAVGGWFVYTQYVAERPSDVVEKFIEAADAVDVNKMIECMPPEYERAWAATGKMAAAFIKVDPRDIFELVPALLPGMAQMTGEDFEYGIEVVEVLDERIRGDDAVIIVRLKMTTTDTDGQVSTEVEDNVA